MAFTINFTDEIKYTNERLDLDDNFKEGFSSLPKQFIESITVIDAYVAVRSVQANKNELHYILDIYKDANKTLLLKSEQHVCTPNLTSDSTPNFYVQSYNHAKTLPQYADAIDC